jgi:phage-related protein
MRRGAGHPSRVGWVTYVTQHLCFVLGCQNQQSNLRTWLFWRDVHFCVNLAGMRKIHFYRTDAGVSPVESFLDSLQGKQAQKIVWVLQLIEELKVVPTQYFKKLVGTDELWEVRVQDGGDIFRILGFLDGGELVVLNHAFQKKTQKLPKKEIEIAQTRKKDYLLRGRLR